MRRKASYPKRKKAYVRLGAATSRSAGRSAKNNRKVYRKVKRAKRVIPVMSKCAVDYFKALYDPWTLKSAPCIPDFIQLPSFKQMTRIRGTLKCNAAGFGFITMNPYLPCNSQSGAAVSNYYYQAPVWYSSGGAGVTTTVPMGLLLNTASTPGQGGTTAAYWNSTVTGPQVESAINNGVTDAIWRPVGGGIKVKYAGRADEMAGTYVLWEDPTNDITLQQTSPAGSTLLQREEASYTSVTNDEVAVTHHQRTPWDIEYSDNWYPISVATTANSVDLANFHTLAVVIEGAVAQASYVFDCVMHWEYLGKNFPSRTASMADVIGMQKAQNTQSTQPAVTSPHDTLINRGKQLIKDATKEAAGQLLSGAVNSYAPGYGPYAELAFNQLIE